MKPSPSGFLAEIGIEIADEDPERDRDQDLHIEDAVPGLMGAMDGRPDRDWCHVMSRIAFDQLPSPSWGVAVRPAITISSPQNARDRSLPKLPASITNRAVN
jgi:hypothetical protein